MAAIKPGSWVEMAAVRPVSASRLETIERRGPTQLQWVASSNGPD